MRPAPVVTVVNLTDQPGLDRLHPNYASRASDCHPVIAKFRRRDSNPSFPVSKTGVSTFGPLRSESYNDSGLLLVLHAGALPVNGFFPHRGQTERWSSIRAQQPLQFATMTARKFRPRRGPLFFVPTMWMFFFDMTIRR